MGTIIFLSLLALIAIGAFVVSFFFKGEENHKARIISRIVSSGFVLLFLLVWLICSFTTVSTGQVKVPTAFGKVVPITLDPGVHFILPWYSTVSVPVSREQIDFNSSAENVVVSKDKLEMGVAVAHPYQINQQHVHLLLGVMGTANFGEKVHQMLQTCGDNAVRHAFSVYKGGDAAGSKKDSTGIVISERFAENVAVQLKSLGINENIAHHVFNFAPSLVARSVLPNRITQENAETQASQVKSNRLDQDLLNADKEAKIAGTDGSGVRAFLNEIGIKNATPNQVAQLMQANAALNYSEALTKAVETGKINTVNFSTLPVSTPSNQ